MKGMLELGSQNELMWPCMSFELCIYDLHGSCEERYDLLKTLRISWCVSIKRSEVIEDLVQCNSQTAVGTI